MHGISQLRGAFTYVIFLTSKLRYRKVDSINATNEELNEAQTLSHFLDVVGKEQLSTVSMLKLC